MALQADDFVTSIAVGTTIAAGASTSAATAIPVTSSGVRPTKIRITATSAIHFQLGTVSVVATANGVMVQPGDATRLRVPAGVTHFAVIQDTVAGNVTVSPCEDT
jgi:hypothetical protein